MSATDQARPGAAAPQLSLFAGTFRHGRDDKGRVVLPAPFRGHFEGAAVVSPGVGYIAVRSVPAFEEWLDKLTHRTDGFGITFKAREDFTQVSQQVAVDGQGRMVVPAWLCAKYGIGEQVRVVGRYDHIGIFPEADDEIDAVIAFLTQLGDTPAT